MKNVMIVSFGDWYENGVELVEWNNFEKESVVDDVVRMGLKNEIEEKVYCEKVGEVFEGIGREGYENDMDIKEMGEIGFDVSNESVSEFGWWYLDVEKMGEKVFDYNGYEVDESCVGEDEKWECVGEYDEENDELVLVEIKEKELIRVVKKSELIDGWEWKK